MKQFKILDWIGVCLIVVAIISAGGLFYTSNEYAKVTETRLNVWSEITNVTMTYSDGEAMLIIEGKAHNPSRLDVEIYGVEYDVYASSMPFTSLNLKNHLAHDYDSGGGDRTVEKGGDSDFIAYFNHLKMDAFLQQLEQNNIDTGFFAVRGEILFTIEGPGGVNEKAYFFYAGEVSLNG